MLTEVNDVIAQAYDLIHNQYGKMIESLEEKARLIQENKAELMENLKEMSKEERYGQILELSQLLSSELYHEREKAREMETYGSYQMELKFDSDREPDKNITGGNDEHDEHDELDKSDIV